MIIGLGYEQKTGKDYAAEILRREAGFRVMSFAAPLYRMAFAAAGMDPDLAESQAQREKFKAGLHPLQVPAVGSPVPSETDDLPLVNGRVLLQWLGTDVVRAGYPGTWVQILASKVHGFWDIGERDFAVTDCRFLNEASCLRNLGEELGTETRLIRIRRFEGCTSMGIAGHVSDEEGSQIVWDRTIVNHWDENFREETLRAAGRVA